MPLNFHGSRYEGSCGSFPSELSIKRGLRKQSQPFVASGRQAASLQRMHQGSEDVTFLKKHSYCFFSLGEMEASLSDYDLVH